MLSRLLPFLCGAPAKIVTFTLRHVGERSSLTQLQSANVRNYPPAIFGRNLRRVIRHCSEPVCFDIEKVSNWRVSQALIVKRRWFSETPLHDHACAVAKPAVANRAVNIESLLSAIEISGSDRHRELGDETLIAWRGRRGSAALLGRLLRNRGLG